MNALDGFVQINEALDRVMEFASLPLSAHPDLDYEDGEVLAYQLEGTEGDDVARVLVGVEPFYEDGMKFKYLNLEVEVDHGPDDFIQGLVREDAKIDVSICYNVEQPEVPTRFIMTLQRPIDIAGCRDRGIDAFHGTYTSGAYFWIDFRRDPDNPYTCTYGIVDGNPVNYGEFDGVRPLAGDINLDPKRAAAMLAKLQAHLASIRGD